MGAMLQMLDLISAFDSKNNGKLLKGPEMPVVLMICVYTIHIFYTVKNAFGCQRVVEPVGSFTVIDKTSYTDITLIQEERRKFWDMD